MVKHSYMNHDHINETHIHTPDEETMESYSCQIEEYFSSSLSAEDHETLDMIEEVL